MQSYSKKKLIQEFALDHHSDVLQLTRLQLEVETFLERLIRFRLDLIVSVVG